MDMAKNAYDKMVQEFPEEAQYVVPMAYNIHWYWHVNLRALQWLCELRSSPAGHPMYRYVAQELAKQVVKSCPLSRDILNLSILMGTILADSAKRYAPKKKAERSCMNDKPGSIIGGVLLVAGSCIGAGMLALPLVTGLSGFAPSLFMMLLVWVFMTATGLLLVEINSWFTQRANIISMAERTLGPIGKVLGWILYLFLFYSLLVAYITGSGSLASTYSIPPWIGSIFFAGLFGAVAYQGTRTVDRWNRVLMAGKILTYLGMVMLGMHYVDPHLLTRVAPPYALISLPVLIVSFGYHNMIPVLMTYMKGDTKRVRPSFGSAVFLPWSSISFGILLFLASFLPKERGVFLKAGKPAGKHPTL